MVVPCLKALRDEFNRLSPERDKGADGTIGDSNHTSRSDHTPDEDSDALRARDADRTNEVHALDVDSTGPWPVPFAHLVWMVIDQERRRWLSATDKCRLEYVIFDRKIYDKDADFEPAPYSGDDPHTNHAHFSARYLTQTENDVRPWGLLEVLDVTKDECKAAVREVLKETATLDLIGDAVLERKFPAPAGVEDADGVWWYGSFDREAYARLLELQKAVQDLTALVTQTHPGGQ